MKTTEDRSRPQVYTKPVPLILQASHQVSTNTILNMLVFQAGARHSTAMGTHASPPSLRMHTHTTPTPTTPTQTHARESLGRAGVLSSPRPGRPAIPPQSPPSRASFGSRVSSRPSRRHAGACRPTEPVERSLVRQTSCNPLLCCDEKEDHLQLGGWLQVGRTAQGPSSSSVARNLQNLGISSQESNMSRGFRVSFA